MEKKEKFDKGLIKLIEEYTKIKLKDFDIKEIEIKSNSAFELPKIKLVIENKTDW